MRIDEIQAALRAEGLDGWLFFDHHHRDPLAYRVLGLPADLHATRRWYYLVPAEGEARGLAHKIEPHALDTLPGQIRLYAGWQQQQQALSELLAGCRSVAMQYSPNCAVPYVSNVDAGTLELVRAAGVEVKTSANLIQHFEARLDAAQFESHLEAGRRVDAIRRAAFARVSDALRAGTALTEYEVQQGIVRAFGENGLVFDHAPIVGVNANASNPHYSPEAGTSATIRPGDLLLIDLWAKLDQPRAVYYDITWMGYCGQTPPAAMANVFAAVSGARDAAWARVRDAAAAQEKLHGYEVDDACRSFLQEQGLAAHFFHRTGHSIGEEVHGNGANMDNYETHDTRLVVAGSLFSVEPGVYLPEFGTRSEINVYRGETGAQITGEVQTRLLELL